MVWGLIEAPVVGDAAEGEEELMGVEGVVGERMEGEMVEVGPSEECLTPFSSSPSSPSSPNLQRTTGIKRKDEWIREGRIAHIFPSMLPFIHSPQIQGQVSQ